MADIPAMLTPWGGGVPEGQPWAADTGCFAAPQRHDDDRYLAWLTARPLDRCIFATAPDVVGDAVATLARSAPMLPRIRALGIRAALVGQDGLEDIEVPWPTFDALFIGGSTAWKLSEASAALVDEARRRGKWTHMGRVNSLRRFRHARSIGCDSVDGTFLRFGPDRRRPELDGWHVDAEMRPMLPF